MPKIQLFNALPSAPSYYLLRLKDGVYTRVHALQSPCTAEGTPVSQIWARHLNKEVYYPLISTPHIGRLEYGLPDGYEIYTAEEIAKVDRQKEV